MEKLNQQFKNRYGVDMDGISAMCYASTWVVKNALEKAASTNKEKIRTALSEIHISNGPAAITPIGRVSFDNSGQTEFITLVVQIVGGRHRTVWPLELASQKPVWPKPYWQHDK